jgi:hypothetical protein
MSYLDITHLFQYFREGSEEDHRKPQSRTSSSEASVLRTGLYLCLCETGFSGITLSCDVIDHPAGTLFDACRRWRDTQRLYTRSQYAPLGEGLFLHISKYSRDCARTAACSGCHINTTRK